MKLKEWMQEEGHTAAWLAERMRVSLSAVRKWMQEVRQPKLPTIKKLRKISQGKVSFDDWD